MNQQRKPYKSFTEEFKLQAIRLIDESDKPISAIARELGLRRNQLYKWKEQMDKKGEVASSKRGRPRKDNQKELVTLKQKTKAS
ncbi:MAG: transposase [Pseudomonadales bacterium]|nr:transposase [Pseudomonadales bacterium]